MLIDPKFTDADPREASIHKMIAGEGDPSIRRIDQGLYRIAHWNFDSYLPGAWDTYPDLGEHTAYGVCDSPEQFMKVLGPTLATGPGKYVVSFVQLKKVDQSPSDGWRWHKWGLYIGEQDPQCEYLFDEPVIEEVWTYHVYKKV